MGGRSGEAKLVFGFSSEGHLVSIHDAPRGANCGVVCPECQVPLVARKGEIRIPHFAHSPGSDCIDEAGALETQAHRFAKNCLEGAVLLLPHFRYLDEAGVSVQVQEVVVEQTRGAIRPDLVCEIQWNGSTTSAPKVLELAVEIKVTHRVDASKAIAFEAQKLRCIEIDISRYRHRTDDEIRRAVISEAPRRWVWKKPPMPITRPQWPTGPIPSGGSFKRPPPFPSEFTAKDWADFNRRHF